MTPSGLCIRAGVIMALLIRLAPGANYFISPTGNDANNGTTTSTPWKTITRVNQANFAPGDRIQFQGGQDFSISGGNSLVIRNSGTATSPIMFTSYGTGKARLVVGNGTTTGIESSACSFLLISNLVIVGAGVTNQPGPGNGLSLFWFNDSQIDQVEISGFRGCGIFLNGCHRTTISGVFAHDNGFAGIYSEGPSTFDVNNNSNLTIRNCRTNDNPGDATKTDLHSGNGILLTMAVDCVIDGCEAARNGANMGATAGGPVGIWTASSSRITIQHCISHDNRSPIIYDGGGFDLDQDSTNCVVQYNYSYNNHGAGILMYTNPGHHNSGNTIRYNLSENDGVGNGSAGIAVSGQDSTSNTTTQIYNNVVFNSGGRNAINGNGDKCPNTIGVRNNIFILKGPGEFTAGMGQAVFQGNLYWNYDSPPSWAGKSTLAAWRLATGNELRNGIATGILADPLITNPGAGPKLTDPTQLKSMTAYRLIGTSPGINAAINLQNAFAINPGTTDFFGNALGAVTAFDVGAQEYQNLGPQILTTSARFNPITLP